MAKFGQLLQQGFIQLRAGIGPSQGGGEGIGIGPHPQGVEADACGGCPPGLGQGVCVARGVAPVRHQQQGGGAGGVGVLAGQQYGLAERRGAPHQIEIELAGQCQQGPGLLGQGGEQVGVIRKDDEGDAIAWALADELRYLLAHRREAITLLPLIQHVLGAHAVGEIHRQDEIPAGLVVNEGGLLPLRAAQGQHQDTPAQGHAPLGLTSLGQQQGEARMGQPGAAGARDRGQAEAHQQRQCQGEGKPGPGEDHLASPLRGRRHSTGRAIQRGALTQRRPQLR